LAMVAIELLGMGIAGSHAWLHAWRCADRTAVAAPRICGPAG
jgi:hypothetical protein